MIKKFEQFNNIDPYGEEDWSNRPHNLDLQGYRDLAINLGLNPTEIWMLDPDFITPTFSFIYNYNGKNLVYDIIYSMDYDVIDMCIMERETLEPETYREQYQVGEQLEKNDDEESFLHRIEELAIRL